MHHRNSLHQIVAAMNSSPAVLLLGPNRTEKTSLALAAAAGFGIRCFMDLDDPRTLAAVRLNPARALTKGPVLVVAIERLPGLLKQLAPVIQRSGRQTGGVLLVGSVDVLDEESEQTDGLSVIRILPLSQGEIDQQREGFIDSLFSGSPFTLPIRDWRESKLEARIVRGGYPRIVHVSTDEQRSHWFERYLNNLLTSQARLFADPEAVIDLPMVLRFLAERPGWLLNLKELGGLLGLEPRAGKRRLELLRRQFLISMLPARTPLSGVRTVGSPRVYLTDTGLAVHLLGANRPSLIQQRGLRAKLIRHLAVLEILKQASCAERGIHAFHFRAVHGPSVDVVLQDQRGRIAGIVVTSARTVRESDSRGLRELATAVGTRFVRGVVLHAGEGEQPLGEGLVGLPIWALWHLQPTATASSAPFANVQGI